jgi:ankyrin repeat protein
MQMEELAKAIKNGNIDKVRELILIEKGVNINQADRGSWTLLGWAAFHGHLDVAKLLIEKGANINQAGMNDWTPLHWASIEGHLEIVKLLIEKGVDINQAGNDGYTPLHHASSKGHLEMVKLLIEKGADINQAGSDGETALYYVSYNGNLEMLKLLIEKGADINQAANDGYTPLHLASYKGHLEMVKLLIEKGTDITYANGDYFVDQFSLEITPFVDIPVKSRYLSQFPVRMALDISGIYVTKYRSIFIKKIRTDLSWIPSRHGLYSKKTRDQIKTILIMALWDHSSNQVRHSTGLIWKIPKYVLFEIFYWLTLNNGTLIILATENEQT